MSVILVVNQTTQVYLLADHASPDEPLDFGSLGAVVYLDDLVEPAINAIAGYNYPERLSVTFITDGLLSNYRRRNLMDGEHFRAVM